MANIVFGQQVAVGDIRPGSIGIEKVALVSLSKDGRREAQILGKDTAGGTHFIHLLNHGYPVLDGFAGFYAFQYQQSRELYSVADHQAIERGFWMSVTDAQENTTVLTEPPTPGDDFYAFRRQVGQGADHFESRFDPQKIALRKHGDHRVFQIMHELTAVDRVRAGNVSLKLRSDGGYLWRRIHAFRALPFGTVERDAAWKAERDAIKVLLKEHCDRCAKVMDVTMDHPHEEWDFYLRGGVRFNRDAEGAYQAVAGESMLTPAVLDNDLQNNELAGRFYRSGAADDDYNDPQSETVAIPTGQPTLRSFTGAHGAWRAASIGYWRMQSDIIRAPEGRRDGRQMAPLARQVFDWFMIGNVMGLLNDNNFDDDLAEARQAYFDQNRERVQAENWDVSGAGSVGNNTFLNFVDTDTLTVRANRQYWKFLRFVRATNSIWNIPTTLVELVPAADYDADGNWMAAKRTAMRTQLQSILGRDIMPVTDATQFGAYNPAPPNS